LSQGGGSVVDMNSLMNHADMINGGFELGLSILVWLNIRRVILDKSVKGVSIIVNVFVTMWGLWNLFYYPHLGQVFSYLCGVGVFIGNGVYLMLLIYYSIKKN